MLGKGVTRMQASPEGLLDMVGVLHGANQWTLLGVFFVSNLELMFVVGLEAR